VDFSDFTYIHESGSRYVHLAHTKDILPVCPCLCKSPGMRRKTGDVLCRCPCHGKGPRFTVSLCGKLPLHRWKDVKNPGARPTCQACHVYACHPPPPPPAKCGACCPFLRAANPVTCEVELVQGEHVGLHRGTFAGPPIRQMTW